MAPTNSTRAADVVLVDAVRETPVQVAQRARRRRILLGAIVLVVLAWLVRLVTGFLADEPVVHASEQQNFFYGSIGSEPGGSLLDPVGGMLPPYAIFLVLPEMFPERLPGGYASLGLVFEQDERGAPRDLPIGVSRRRRLGSDLIGLNCAVCHVGTYRTHPSGPRRIVPGMPAHQLDLQRLFAFVLESILDPRFTGENVVGHVEARFGRLGALERWLLGSVVVPQLRERSLVQRSQIGLLFSEHATVWGPGRVDTFNPYKALQFNWDLARLPESQLAAASDFPSLWNQAPRAGLALHWDGNNPSLDERNLSAGLGAGITPVTVDHAAIARVKAYTLALPSPEWPAGEDMPLDEAAAGRGEELFREHCAECHAFDGARLGEVVPLAEIGTDPARLESYTSEFAENQNTLFPDSPQRFRSFRKTDGYVNQPLDGIWARAPYLHNGSVPTLADLLEPADARPTRFHRGYDVYDPQRVGFVSDVEQADGRRFFLFRVLDEQGKPVPGNSNRGHEYGAALAPEEKRELLEYLKKL